MIAIGVARPRAQGQAMMRTETAATSACAKRGSGPTTAHVAKATAATATTAGTNHAATASARRWTFARLRCASATSWTIRASRVSFPTFSARITKPPVPLTVEPVTRAPGPFSTGTGSPVSIDSSTLEAPSRTTPSTGTFSPGRTRSRSPGRTSSSGTSLSLPSSASRRAVFGARPSSALIAPLVRARARSSSTCPISTSVTMAAADSKYRPTSPSCCRNEAGKIPGPRTAARL